MGDYYVMTTDHHAAEIFKDFFTYSTAPALHHSIHHSIYPLHITTASLYDTTAPPLYRSTALPLNHTTAPLLRHARAMGNDNPVVKGWQVFRDIEEAIRNMVLVLPLVNDLHNDAMRGRHWKQLAQACDVKSVDPSNPKFTLDDILCLKLHRRVDDGG